MIKIEMLDPVHSRILEGKELLKPCLSYPAEFYRQGQYQKIRKQYRKNLIGKDGIFLTGFVPKAKEYCQANKIKLEIDGSNIERLQATREPHVNGKDIKKGKYSYQYDLIQDCIEHQRGVIKAATGTGKTVMMVGLISCCPNSNVLFLSNTHVALSQFRETVLECGLSKIASITVNTIQGFHRKPPEHYATFYDIIMIDECDVGMLFSGMYHKVLTNSLAPIRLGFTATLPNTVEGRFALEGLLGPVIGELTIQEGTEREVLAKPKILMSEIPFNSSIRALRKYQDVYKAGVVNNRALNRRIIKDAIKDTENGRPTLILITEIQHGENLLEMADRFDFPLTFVEGKTDKEFRDNVRHAMEDLNIDCVVATSVFRRALNITALGSVIIAYGGKFPEQAIGRGLRATKDKKHVIIRDYFSSSHPFLISHFGTRLCLYFRERWEMGIEE